MSAYKAAVVVLLLAPRVWAQGGEAEKPASAKVVDLQAPLRGVALEVARVKLKQPVEITVAGARKKVDRLLEFRLRMAEPFPVRALDPVLSVGKVKLREYRYEDDGRTLVFSLPEVEKARDGAALRFEFEGDPATATAVGIYRAKAAKDVTR